ncbi:MAG: phosphatase PAP2 family protein [Acidimicrobiia bacterium]|nr:phosphatase PAP2 family protein [Acidimicrobiia bacterium]
MSAPDEAEPTTGATDVAPGILDRFDTVRRFDDGVDQAFERLRGNRLADRSFYTITELGDFGLVWIVLGGVRALTDVDEDGTCDPHNEFARLVVAMAAESVFVNGVVKSLVRRERPVVQEPRPHKLRIPLTTSFPSGHASSAMVAASLLGEGRRTAPLYYGLGLWVASSRIYVKIHHASDVVCGLALGLVLGRMARRVWPRTR